jgi:putative transposase
MAYTRYRIRDSAYPHFITSAIVRWLPILRSQPRTEVILDSLRFLRNEGSICLHAYVVMEDHIHLVASSPDLSRNVRRFLSFTARQLIDHLTESGETAHLRALERNRLDNRKSHRYQVWRPGFHPQALLSNSMMDQKINYIHENPVRKGLGQRAEDWTYSSLAYLKGASHLPPVDQAIL